MVGAAGVVCGLTEHGAQFGRAALRDPPVGVAVPGLIRRGHDAGVARRVFRIGEAGDVGEDGDRRRGHDGTNARDRLEPPERVGEPGPLLLR